MNRAIVGFLTGWLLVVGLFLSGVALGRIMMSRHDPIPYYVTDKGEFGGKCYVQTWVEVTPE